jgi:hypothetical protein
MSESYARKDGFDAFTDGNAIIDNPFIQFPSLRENGLARAWADGWVEARDQYRNAERPHRARTA